MEKDEQEKKENVWKDNHQEKEELSGQFRILEI